MAAISPARWAAFRILLEMERGRAHADDLLRRREVNALSPADRNLATALVFGVLRWQIWLDKRVRPLLKKPGAKLEPAVLVALRMGAFQLFFLDRIPAHAAISESVELVKHAGHRFASGMVNAVLRSLARPRDPREDRLDATAVGAAPSATIDAAVEAHPAWMVERWVRFYGAEAAQAICLHGQRQPATVVRIEGEGTEDELIQSGIQLAPGALLTCARLVTAGDVTATAAYREGRVRIQDEGSQLIAELAACGEGSDATKPENVLDACAAPGGKTLILAERMSEARILACEASAQRLAVMREKLGAHAKRVDFRHADAAAFAEQEKFDLALVDAPCSGTGTLGRNPEIRHRLKPEDLSRHAERQRAILRAVLRAARPGGGVIYSTCSLEREENEEVVAALLAEAPGMRQTSLAPRIDALLEQNILSTAAGEELRRSLTPEGALQLRPGALGTDGFFIALIEKSS
jgi:16S rRNA (cytosine967-C5)-methyltransferase